MLRITITLLKAHLILLMGLFLPCVPLAAQDTGTQAQVVPVTSPLKVDGKLDEAVWQTAPRHDLTLVDSSDKLPELTREAIRRDHYEAGNVRLLIDNDTLYIGIDFSDRDIVAQGTENQSMLFSSGDVAEIFLKSDDAPGYFELYVSPHGKQSSFYFPSGGYLGLPDSFMEPALPGMRVAAVVTGTLNDPRDEDKGWTAEMAIPLAELQAKSGVPFSLAGRWRILVARYNYGVQMRTKQHSAFPPLPQLNFHLQEYYAPLTPVSVQRDQEKRIQSHLSPPHLFNQQPQILESDDLYVMSAVTFPSLVQSPHENNNTIHAEYYLPNGIKPDGPKRPAVIVLHILGGNFELARLSARLLASRGIPAIMMKMPYYGERSIEGGRGAVMRDPQLLAAFLPQAIADVRRTVDFLQDRPEIDPQKIGVMGISLGSLIGAAAAGEDERIYKALLVLGGGDLKTIIGNASEAEILRKTLDNLPPAERTLVEQAIDEADPLRYADKLRARAMSGKVRMINAGNDEVIPRTCTQKLAEKLGIADKVVWKEGLGHYSAMAALPQILQEISDFFADDLPPGIETKTQKPQMRPVERAAVVLRDLGAMLGTEPQPERGHLLAGVFTLQHGNGKEIAGSMRYLRGSGERFRLEVNLLKWKHIILGNGAYPWMGLTDKTFFAGTENPHLGGSPLEGVDPSALLKAKIILGAISGMAMVPDMLEQYAEFTEEGADAIHINVKKTKGNLPINATIRFQPEGITPQAIEIDAPGFASGTVTLKQWAVSTVAPEELFAVPTGVKIMAVNQQDVFGMFAGTVNFLLEAIQ